MKRCLSQLLLGGAFILATILIALQLAPRPPLLDSVSFSPVVYDRRGELLRFGLATDDSFRQFVPLDQISPLLIESTLLYEDRYFYQHTGTNPVALAKAFWNELSHSHRRIGASTITMQVARLRYRLNTRTWTGKLIQILMAARIESHYSKRQILEAYFNLAPYGRNIEGVGAASRLYFGKEAADLSLAEALTLSVIPQNPTRRAPGAKSEQPLLDARRGLFEAWVQKHPADLEKRSIFDMPMQVRTLSKVPFRAPHFSEDCLQSVTDSRHLLTTLDWRWQQLLERQLATTLVERSREGLTNASALLIDYRTMEVLASVGSADYFNTAINGQVNGTRMKRSPGSALKPFVYALALDQGLIQPHSLLKDAPTSFNGYNPENFDRDFMGPVQACDALVQSRNVPAVTLASKLSEHSLYALLQGAEVSGLRPESSYGLTIALGGVEVSPEDIAGIYAMLANRGEYRPLRKITNAPTEKSRRLLSPEASFLVLDMLKKNNLPAYQGIRASTSASRPIAWKTGTSYSFRDAWTAGVFDHYVLVVWVGNFDGKPNPALIGRSAAAPLFFSIVNALRAQSPPNATPSSWESSNQLNLARVDLCAVTGELAGAHCQHQKSGWFIPGVSPLKTCAVHQEILIDPRTGYRVANADNVPNVRHEVVEIWPSDLQTLFRFAGLPRATPPPFAPDARPTANSTTTTLEITSPRAGMEYQLRVGSNDQSIPLQAQASSTTRLIYWFAGKNYLGSSAPGETIQWSALPGAFTICAINEGGHSVTRRVVVAATQ
ncbi:MAG: penicillin-binding protein 1C [Verrucomicrobia bacterium Tous-C9LFEB]|nr:MAG: penicillin-binding protein 1C [Verrucomicrobia bacterium Tous-C9LFEB]